MKKLQITLTSLIIMFFGLLIAQLWFDFFSEEVFFKISTTLAIIFVAIILIFLIRKHFLDEEKLKKDKFIN